eukprot:TRINITY_DN27049_c0_g2_i1.p1 TRINITY_DN27049_c0_g2~~TRINITY_DN27049_c0_g2_i1.p1  ORF type:complete len:498 (-),score=104.86 TRINITY_DN27049_c0_g2_i1:10-1503(-)
MAPPPRSGGGRAVAPAGRSPSPTRTPTAAQSLAACQRLEAAKSRLQGEIAELTRAKEEAQRQCEETDELAKTASGREEELRRRLRELGSQEEELRQQASDVDSRWEKDRADIEDNVSSLRSELSLWWQRSDRLTRLLAQRRHDLAATETEIEEGAQERFQMQAKFLDLQHESEDARLSLHEARELITASGSILERLDAKRIELERAMHDRAQQKLHLQSVMMKAEEAKRIEADAGRRRHSLLVASTQRQREQYRADAERHRQTAVRLQREVEVAQEELSRLERDSCGNDSEVAKLELSIRDAQSATLEEQRLEAAARDLLLCAQARRDMLERRLAELRGQSKLEGKETLDLQEEHARLLLKEARRQASAAMRSTEKLGMKAVSAPDCKELEICNGYFMPAGHSWNQRKSQSPRPGRAVAVVNKAAGWGSDLSPKHGGQVARSHARRPPSLSPDGRAAGLMEGKESGLHAGRKLAVPMPTKSLTSPVSPASKHAPRPI